MCGSKMRTDALEPNSTPRHSRISRTTKASESPRASRTKPSERIPNFSITDPSTSNAASANYTTGSSYRDSSRSSISSRTSLSSLRLSLPESPHIYNFSEICSATKNFLAKRFSSSSSSSSSSPAWRCSIHGKDVIVFQRKFRRPMETPMLRDRLSSICKSHHSSIIKLLGASISGNHIYLVYDYVTGANLADCLRNPKNPNFTVLSTWISRMQVADDLARGLDYIHNCTGLNLSLVHNHIKSTSVIITEPSFNGKICHFGTAELCGEIAEDHRDQKKSKIAEIVEDSPSLKRSDSRNMKFQGTRGYMSPEYQSTGIATQKSDVFAFGVVILELLSGEEALKYRIDEARGDYRRISVIETGREAMEDCGEGEAGGRLRKWVDKRLKDSFPVEVAMKMTRVALDCVDVDPDKRPDMGRVVGMISKLYLESRDWSERMSVPADFTVSFAPR